MPDQKIKEFPMNSTYYWVTARLFPAQCGDILEAGRWGKKFRERRSTFSEAFWDVQELVYEIVRLRYYADQISRLEALFFFDNIDSARKFAPKGLVYEIELFDQDAKVERHIMDDIGDGLYESYIGEDFITSIAEIEKNAHGYWNYTPRPQATVELLTQSPAKIIRRI